VLLVDLDPQGNATMGSGIDKRALAQTVYHVLLGLSTIERVRVRSEGGGYDVLPANRELAGAEVEMVDLDHRETRLKGALERVSGDYDYVLLDCPPSLSLLTLNGLVAAHAVMIPMQCEYYALEGLSDLVNTIKKVRAHFNPTIEIEGLLRTMFDPRNTLSQQVADQLKSHFPDKVLDTIVPRNVRLAEAPSYGLPAIKFDSACKGSQAYVALAEEILWRAEVRVAAQRTEGAAQ
jgi:chromosome partitioning protein